MRWRELKVGMDVRYQHRLWGKLVVKVMVLHEQDHRVDVEEFTNKHGTIYYTKVPMKLLTKIK